MDKDCGDGKWVAISNPFIATHFPSPLLKG
jgi:hypothetical protein